MTDTPLPWRAPLCFDVPITVEFTTDDTSLDVFHAGHLRSYSRASWKESLPDADVAAIRLIGRL